MCKMFRRTILPGDVEVRLARETDVCTARVRTLD